MAAPLGHAQRCAHHDKHQQCVDWSLVTVHRALRDCMADSHHCNNLTAARAAPLVVYIKRKQTQLSNPWNKANPEP
eukprot:11168973-Lingulodinium_polyedra.AAC.1